MKETQKVGHDRERMNELKYAVAYWYTLSDRQQELIYQQADWN